MDTIFETKCHGFENEILKGYYQTLDLHHFEKSLFLDQCENSTNWEPPCLNI